MHPEELSETLLTIGFRHVATCRLVALSSKACEADIRFAQFSSPSQRADRRELALLERLS